jgi:hypothetical protein
VAHWAAGAWVGGLGVAASVHTAERATPPTHDRLPGFSHAAETELLRILADGRYREVEPLATALRRRQPLLAEIITADAGARLAEITLPDLRALLHRAADEAPEHPLLRWWVLAIMGERAFLDADLGVIPLVPPTLAELPEDPFVGAPLLYMRGRLRRIASAIYLVAPSPENLAEHRRLRDLAVADFLRCSLMAEVALTRGLSAALLAIAAWEDATENLALVHDAKALLGEPDGSMWIPLLTHLELLAAVAVGDRDASGAAARTLAELGDLHPVYAAFATHGIALHEVVATDGAAPAVEAMTAALDGLRRTHPHLLALTQLQVAHFLADFGHGAAARAFGQAGLHWPPTNTIIAIMGELLRTRLDLVDGVSRAGDAAAVDRAVHRLEELGHVRHAGTIALRVARDLERADRPDEAARLRAWGLERLPAPRHRTPNEHRWAEPVHGRPAAAPAHVRTAAPTSTIQVRVLAPVLELDVAGTPVRLRDMPAKLLLALLLAQPDPLHVEQAIDTLWPDASPEVGRGRLNTVVHRLRGGLGLDAQQLRRTGDVLLLDTTGWTVDLLALRRALGSDDASSTLDALRAARGNLCQVQFPYDDLFADHRRALAATVARTLDELAPDDAGASADASPGAPVPASPEELAGIRRVLQTDQLTT